jgi:hypothetical protein
VPSSKGSTGYAMPEPTGPEGTANWTIAVSLILISC